MTDDAPDPFADLDAYVALPRLGGLALSPDGTRLVTAVSTLSPDRKRHVTSLWQVDPAGEAPARRLTRSAKGEGAPAFLPDGTLLFTSGRPDAEAESPADDDPPALWALPPVGEARVVATRPGGVTGAVTARDADVVVAASATLPGSVTADDDAERRKARKDRKVAAILHEGYPIRYWDHDLGPDEPRLVAGTGVAAAAAGGLPGDARVDLVDCTPAPGRRFDEADVAVTPDGATIYATASVPGAGGPRSVLVAVDTGLGPDGDGTPGPERVVLAGDDVEFGGATISPDGSRAIVVVSTDGDATEPPQRRILVLDLATGDTCTIAPDWDRWPGGFAWLPDGSAVLCTADDLGAAPVFRIDVPADLPAGGTVGATATRLTTDHGAYAHVVVAPDGSAAYAVRAPVDAAPHVVRLDPAVPGEPEALPGPAGADPAVPGRLVEVTATAEDGTALRAWLCLPDGASADDPAPLLVWIHGGPLGSWNAWSWRWNPWLAVAEGYAVVLPDPALSTGYGIDFIRRGWGRWGAEPYTDVLALADAACAHDAVDATRTAAMGGSFGGYMANWVAGHTDRFDAIVTHASLWALPSFGPTTDRADYWRRELTEAMAEEWSPHRFVDRMTTPMLVIHGDKDYRVPIGEALFLWSELARHHMADDGTMPHKLLYYPDENHWILQPQHARLWYQTVFAFLAHHVRGEPWETPELLR